MHGSSLGAVARVLVLGWLSATALASGANLHKSGPIQITADGAFVWAVNPDHDLISRLRTADNDVVTFALPAGSRPRGLALTPDGAAVWVAAELSDRVYVLSTSDGSVLATLEFSHGAAPASVTISPNGTQALVTLFRKGSVAFCDVASRSVVATIDGLVPRPFGACYTSVPNQAWIVHRFNDGEHGYVTALDTATRKVTTVLKMASPSPKFLVEVAGDPPGVDQIPEAGYIFPTAHIAQRPGADTLWLAVQYQNFGSTQFTPDSTVQSAVHRISLITRLFSPDDRIVLTAVHAHRNNGQYLGDGWDAGVSSPADVAFDAAGTTAYTVHRYSNDLIAVAATATPERPAATPQFTEVPVGEFPVGIVISPVANVAYVLNELSRDISIVDLGTLTETARIPATPGSPEPLPPAVLLGNKLFNSSADPRISANNKVACASCHPGGETDGLPWDVFQLGNGNRKSLHLTGLALTFGPQVGGRGQLHRSGDRDELQDFDHTFRGPQMGGTGFLAAINPPLGPTNAGIDADLDAIETYALSLDPIQRSPHRNSDGTLTAAAVRGAAIFNAGVGSPAYVGCNACHPSPTFADQQFHDVGGFAPPPENEGPAFNTAGLVDAWAMFPYRQLFGGDKTSRQSGMHLWDVVRHAESGVHGNTAALTRTQKRDLAAFLESIDGALADTGSTGIVDAAGPRVVAVYPLNLNTVKVIFDETVDAATAGDPANYVFDDGVAPVIATAAVVDAALGNHVLVTAALHYYGCDRTYTFLPGPIQDVAGAVSGGANNTLNTTDPANQPSFTLDGTITVTFGDSGAETFAGVGRDACFQSNASNLSHTRLRLYPGPGVEQKGFVRFDFTSALAGVCGVTSSAQIVDARFSGRPELGHGQTLEIRRCFKPWGDPPRDFCAACVGSVTRSFATYPTIMWGANGAGSIGGPGTNPAEYYPTATFDMAALTDATVSATALDQPVTFSSAAILSAFRLWFDNPTRNFGYAVEVVGNTNNTGIEFWSNEANDGRNGWTLSITYTLAAETSGFADCNNNTQPDECEIAAGTAPDVNGNGIPDGCEASPGDMNCDGVVDFFDIDPFLLALFDPPGYDAAFPTCNRLLADVNNDTVVDFFDIDGFLAILFG